MSTSNDVEDDGTTAGGRRRRGSHRAASRPAGPPVDLPAAPAQTATSGAAQDGAPAQRPEPDPSPVRSRPAAALPLFQAASEPAPREAAGPEPSREEPTAASAAPAPAVEEPAPTGRPRRRRAASRPAGPPVDAPAVPAAPAAPAAPAPEAGASASTPAASTPAAGTPASDTAADAPDTRPARAPRTRRQAGTTAASADTGGSRRLAPGSLSSLGAPPPVAVEAQPADDDADDADDADEVLDADARDDAPGDPADETADETAPDDPTGADAVDPESDEDDATDDKDSPSRRGRRRRGGRGRRRRGADDGPDADGDDEADEPAAASPDEVEGADGSGGAPQGSAARVDAVSGDGAPAEDDDADDDEDDDTAEDSADTGPGSSRRRRRRRRRGGPGIDADDEETDAAEASAPAGSSSRRSRSRRSSSGSTSGSSPASSRESTDSDDVTAVKGSTRLEAKRQRRRDGRDGARRPRVLSEAEFLARRESVERTMVVRVRDGRSQVAVLEDGVLVEHYAARKQQTSMIGNVHLGRVQNVLPSMEAAFVDIGRGRNAVLYAGEVDWDAAGLSGQAKKIESALKSGDPVLVQVTKDPIGHKGARLTSQVSLPGRYLVYVPAGSMTGISRKLPDTERSRLKSILKEVVPEDAGVIVRTAAEGASEEELRRDVERLAAQWEEISTRAGQVTPPTLLHGEPDLVIKVVRDVFNEDFTRLVVEGDEAWEAIEPYVASVAPDLAERVSRWDESQGAGAFAHHRVDEQIAKALERKVWLPSGGSLVIDRTEAMTVVDVNTGRFTGSGGNLEETVTRNNLEAAEEIVRQLRLRDIGGIVVVDFIDMVLESNRDLVLRRLVECLGRDRSKHQVAEVTSLGLVQMTRKRVGQGLLETFSEPCEHCAGRGVVVADDLGGGGHGAQQPSAPHAGHGQGGRGGRSDQRSEQREPVRGPSRDQTREQTRDQTREQPREQPREQGRDQGRDQGRERSSEEHPAVDPDAPRSREEAARDAVREAMNGIALATLRPHRPEGADGGASLEAAALLAALGTPPAPTADGAEDADSAGGAGEVAAVDRVEVEVVTVEPVDDAGPSTLPDLQHDAPGERADDDQGRAEPW